VDEHQVMTVVYLGDDLCDLDAFHVLKSLRARRHCEKPSSGILHADAPARLMRSVDVLVDGPACVKALKGSCFFPFWMRFATTLHYTRFASA